MIKEHTRPLRSTATADLYAFASFEVTCGYVVCSQRWRHMRGFHALYPLKPPMMPS